MYSMYCTYVRFYSSIIIIPIAIIIGYSTILLALVIIRLPPSFLRIYMGWWGFSSVPRNEEWV